MEGKNLQIAVTEEEIKSAIVAKANDYKEIYKGKKLLLVCELSGAFIFLADLVRELQLDVSIKFVTFGNKDGDKDITLDIETKSFISENNVLIISDVFYKGNTLGKLKEIVDSQNPESTRILVLGNRKCDNKNKSIEVDALFDLDERRVVGYGLADHESFRGLKDLYYLTEGD